MSLDKLIFEFPYIILLIFSIYGLFNFEKTVKLAYKFYQSINIYNKSFLFTDSYLRITLRIFLIVGFFMGVIVTIDFICNLLGSNLQEIIYLFR
ncbi:hypothetical protein [Tepidibacter mesophilus]|uniref:hypothetical protein n=1 Tax=Tepidibacter mesophilus TaxID=655607 RepID=UPI000C06F524|nr:hypothetical protein [Tepidibacter mesophilus]